MKGKDRLGREQTLVDMEMTTARFVVDTSKYIMSSLKLRKSDILCRPTQSGRRRTNTVRAANVKYLNEAKEELTVAKVVLTKASNDDAKVLEVDEGIDKKIYDRSE